MTRPGTIMVIGLCVVGSWGAIWIVWQILAWLGKGWLW